MDGSAGRGQLPTLWLATRARSIVWRQQNGGGWVRRQGVVNERGRTVMARERLNGKLVILETGRAYLVFWSSKTCIGVGVASHNNAFAPPGYRSLHTHRHPRTSFSGVLLLPSSSSWRQRGFRVGLGIQKEWNAFQISGILIDPSISYDCSSGDSCFSLSPEAFAFLWRVRDIFSDSYPLKFPCPLQRSLWEATFKDLRFQTLGEKLRH